MKLKDLHISKKLVCIGYGILILVIAYHAAFAQKIIPGVRVGALNVGGLTYLQAKNALQSYEGKVSKVVTFKLDNKEFKISGSEISLVYDWDSSVSRAFEVGRTGNFFVDNKDKIAGILRGLYIGAIYDYDDNLLAGKIAVIQAENNVEMQDASIILAEDGSLTVVPSKEGVKVVGDSFYNALVNSFDRLDFSIKTLPVKKVIPKILESDLKSVLPEVQKIVANQITIKGGSKSWVLDKTQLLNLLQFQKKDNVEISLNEPKFEAYRDSLAQDVNQLPRGQVTRMEGNKVLDFVLTKDGQELDDIAFTQKFKDALFNFQASVDIPMKVVSGPATKEMYGILTLLGEGVSTYVGSGVSRIHNLTLAADKTNGVLVPPGAIYSMNNSVGEINAQTGFDTAYIIQEGRTVLGSGGGVCQTSTTLFRAVLNAGLPVVTRHTHAYRVSYYEQNMPVGFDAAVYQPTWDFQFKNDTPSYVLVQTSYDLNAQSLTFRLYGTPDGRSVDISKPVITNQTPPPPALYQDDPTLSKGVTKQVDFPAWGASVKFTRTVKKGDQVLFQDVFSSSYQPWRAIYLVGTK